MDLFCNQDLVKKTTKSKNKMQLNSNNGTMMVSQKATVTGYHKSVWFNKKTSTNIIALRNPRLQ